MRFHFVVVVWGESNITSFLEVIVPNLLSEGNLPAVRSREQSVVRIYTAPNDVARIKSSPAFVRLSHVIRTEVVSPIDIRFDISKYEIMAAFHRAAIRAADEDGAAFLILPPDAIWPEGSFRRAEEIAESGKRLLLCAGLRVGRETFVPEFLQRHYCCTTGLAPVSSRDLVRLSMRHLHPMTRSHFWDSPIFHPWPALLLWEVEDDGILMYAFHLHPLMVNPPRKGIMAHGTIDAEYVRLACPSPDDLYVATDSDEMVLIDIGEVSDSRGNPPFGPGTSSIPAIARWASRHSNELHRQLVQHAIRIHTGGGAASWDRVKQVAAKVVGDIIDQIPHVPPEPPAEAPVSAPVGHEPAPLATPAPGWRRFLAPSFLVRKIREHGVSGCLRKGMKKVLRRSHG